MPAKLNITDEEIDQILPLNNPTNATKNKTVKRMLNSGICLNEQECKEKVMASQKVTLNEFNQIWNAFAKFLEVQNAIVDYDNIKKEDNIFINGFGRFKYRIQSIANDNMKGKIGRRGRKM